jgi:hypothetical protein
MKTFILFALIGGWFMWLPKLIDREYGEALKWAGATVVVGVFVLGLDTLIRQ